MLKHSETIINASVRRQDTTWDYRWDFYNQEDPNTIYLRPDMEVEGSGSNTTWHFNGDADELRQYDESTWDPKHPVFEYEVDPDGNGEGPDAYTAEWDSKNPNNKTRYLRPGHNKFISITNTVKNVTIDPIPPAFVSDYGTEYLSLACDYDGITKNNKTYSSATRKLAIEFKDDVGLDYKQVAVFKGDIDFDPNALPSEEETIYYYDRSKDEAIRKDYVSSIRFNATKAGQYQLVVELFEKWKGEETRDIKEELNGGLTFVVFDLAGNYSVYKLKRQFKTLEIDDLNKLNRVIITFVDIEPNNYFLEDGVEGKIVTHVQDPNTILWEYENVFGLTEQSIGAIDKNAIESNLEHNPLDGLSKFIITSLKDSGIVEVEAWVETGFPEIDELIKERTYNTAICGPWVYGDEGRKYHITPYVPKYLHGTEFADFMEFFQLYINTMYKGLDNNRYISGLEKIARIGNFNDISRLEDALVYHYATEFGNEFDFDVQSLQEVNLIQNGSGFTNRDTKETFEIIKYVLEQLPAYNRYKGTNTGITMGIKMFGFASKVINLWVKIADEVEHNPEFIEEDSLFSFEGYFMTSRFNLNLDAANNTFETFCNNIELFIDLIKSIKPITKILNLIKYTIPLEKPINLIYSLDNVADEKECITYKLTWNLGIDNIDDVMTIKQLCDVDSSTGNAKLFGLNYTPKCEIEGMPKLSNVYNILGKFFRNNKTGITFRVEKGNNVSDFTFNDYEVMLNPGSFFMCMKGNNGTTAKDLLNYIDVDSIINETQKSNPDHSKDVTIKTEIILQPGTNYAKCGI